MQLAELRQQQGQTGDEGPQEPLKPLTQVLAENKEAHEAKFQAVWKSMKTGVLLHELSNEYLGVHMRACVHAHGCVGCSACQCTFHKVFM